MIASGSCDRLRCILRSLFRGGRIPPSMYRVAALVLLHARLQGSEGVCLEQRTASTWLVRAVNTDTPTPLSASECVCSERFTPGHSSSSDKNKSDSKMPGRAKFTSFPNTIFYRTNYLPDTMSHRTDRPRFMFAWRDVSQRSIYSAPSAPKILTPSLSPDFLEMSTPTSCLV